jgi:hypothetical protein
VFHYTLISGKRKEAALERGGFCGEEKVNGCGTGIPAHEVEIPARVPLPEIQAFFESEEGRRAFDVWKVQQGIRTRYPLGQCGLDDLVPGPVSRLCGVSPRRQPEAVHAGNDLNQRHPGRLCPGGEAKSAAGSELWADPAKAPEKNFKNPLTLP